MATCFTISLMFLLMTADVDGQQDWGVKYNPSYVCALRGSTVRMSCIYPPDHVVNKTFWTKTNVTTEEPDDMCLYRRVQCHSENKDSYSITLTNVTEADKGVYYCRFITNKQGGKWTGDPGVQLDVTDLQVETQQRVKEGDSVTLTCKTTCRLTEETTFIWYRNTQTLTEHTVNEFHLQSVSRHDSGLYRCAIKGHEHLSSPGVNLDVEYPPEKTSVSINSSGVIVEGDSVNLTCSSESNPPVHIYSWFEGKKMVKSGNIYSISSVRSNHSGKYKCKTRNTHGVKYSEAVMLNVMYAPRNVSVSISSSGVIVEGDSVTLTCSSESNPPVHIYSWFKENQTSSVGSGQTFSISNINSSLSGWFYCVAQNKQGSQRSAAVSLTVKGSALQTFTGIMAGCGGLCFIIIISIFLFKWTKWKAGGFEVNRQNKGNHFTGSAGASSANDVPLYSLSIANQREVSVSADADDVQYASVHHIRKKERRNIKKQKNSHQTSDPHRSADVIYSSVI
ncbi:CD166 antigen [Triplophysa tibetana]|uniref:CD166 antigen n=1 Tax=Triplophysa tibetana TaxID=1572043 RepID=A0A5A9PJ31_9TELE|nr:CD166 antigen [Triplophysa tibetana]